MQAIRRKLNSQRGASMLMALLLMLVGIMVSAFIISAATSAAVNKRSEKEQQQAWEAMTMEEHVAYYEEQGQNRKDAMKSAAKDRGISKRDVYQALLSGKEE